MLSTLKGVWEPGGVPTGMRLMGQRFTPDSHVLGSLVYGKVGVWPDSLRGLPKGLDVMAALGSQRARQHLLATYDEGRFLNYTSQLDRATAEFAQFTDADWDRAIQLEWLYALKANLEPVAGFDSGAAVPRFVGSDAYADKSLMTASGSWAEQRHDVLLYAKEPYIEFGGVPPPPPKHQAYVEPKPRVFLQVAHMARELSRWLSVSSVAAQPTLDVCDDLAELCERYARIAQGELQGMNLCEDDVDFCYSTSWRFAGVLDRLASIFADTSHASFGLDVRPEPMPVVADVVTDPEHHEVLEVAVGNPCRLYTLIPFYGKTYAAVGACFSYYEFAKPQNARMSDEEWRAMQPKPPMPRWTQSVVRR
jgi:hypothetical protein